MSDENCAPTIDNCGLGEVSASSQNINNNLAHTMFARNHSTEEVTKPRGIPRSNSLGTLFNDDEVLEVAIEECNSPPDYSKKSMRTAPRSLFVEKKVLIQDLLLNRKLALKVGLNTTFGELKEMTQTAQAAAGVRLIPQQYQLITIGGVECSDSSFVFDDLEEHRQNCYCSEQCMQVQPRITELAAFFLSICDRAEGAELGDTEEEDDILSEENDVDKQPERREDRSCSNSDSEYPDVALMFGDMEGINNGSTTHNTSEESSSSPQSPDSSSPRWSSALIDNMHWSGANTDWLKLSAGTDMVVEDLMNSESALERALSERTTPHSNPAFLAPRTSCEPPLPYFGVAVAQQLQGIHAQSFGPASILQSRLLAPPTKTSASQEAILLRRVPSDADSTHHHDESSGFSSHLHFILRNREFSLPVLQRLKLDALEELVLHVQSGLRHGHGPCRPVDFSDDVVVNCEQVSSDSSSAVSSPEFDYGELVTGCCGGTYCMRNSTGKQCAIFKPVDEEPYAPMNPKGYSGSSMNVESAMKPGICVGEGAVRECAAFLLDHRGFANVPTTAMLYITHSSIRPNNVVQAQIKVGSLQKFVPHECTAEDMGTNRMRERDVHNIGIFDIRTFNMDRNSDNVLVAEDTEIDDGFVKLISIDHGYILPSCKHLEDVNLCWVHWPQAKRPYSAETLAFINGLDAEADMEMLRTNLGLSEDSLITLFLGTTLIKVAARAGLTLYDTALLAIREDPSLPSAVEEALTQAQEVVGIDQQDCWNSERMRTELGLAIERIIKRAQTETRLSSTFRSFYRTASEKMLPALDREAESD